MSLNAWLRSAARARLAKRQSVKLFETPEDVEEFFRYCASLEGPETETDWEEHLAVINESRGKGSAGS